MLFFMSGRSQVTVGRGSRITYLITKLAIKAKCLTMADDNAMVMAAWQMPYHLLLQVPLQHVYIYVYLPCSFR